MIRHKICAIFVIVFLFVGGCAAYKRQPAPFKLPSAYPNVTTVAGAAIAAKAYEDPREAKKAFGFDIRDAGLYPVQVVFDNLGDHSFEVEPSQTFLIDGNGDIWAIIDLALAYDRVAKKTELSRIAKGAGKSGFLTGAAGALLGAAVGIVTGENVLESAGKGAAVGGAVGATAGGGAAVISEREARAQISQDLKQKSLENKAVTPGTIAHGFIFFPGEATGLGELRLRLRVIETGELRTLRFPL